MREYGVRGSLIGVFSLKHSNLILGKESDQASGAYLNRKQNSGTFVN